MIINEVFTPINYVNAYVNTNDIFPSNTSSNNDEYHYSTIYVPDYISEISRQIHKKMFNNNVLDNENQSNQITTYNSNNNIPLYIFIQHSMKSSYSSTHSPVSEDNK